MPSKRPLSGSSEDSRPRGLVHQALPQYITSQSTSTLRSILPKRTWKPLPESLPLPNRIREQQNLCPLLACRRPNCTLRTHHQYGLVAKSRRQKSPTIKEEDKDMTLNSIQGAHPELLEQLLPKLPSVNSLNGLEQLPEVVAGDALFRQLFHEFFSEIYNSIRVILVPPPVNATDRNLSFDKCMKSPAYCLNAIASVSTRTMMKGNENSFDRTSGVLYGKIMQILRKQIAEFDLREVDTLLMIVMTLAMLDVVIGQISHLHVHRRGMDQLVTRKGGIHNLTASLAITLALDRLLAIFMCELPLYARPVPYEFERPLRFPERYGSYFKDSEIDEEVSTFCMDVCRVLEIFEGAEISFDPNKANIPRPGRDVLYFYFSRDRLGAQFLQLHCQYRNERSKTRCVLLAAKVVEYTVLMDNYISTIPRFLVTKIKRLIDEMNELPRRAGWDGEEEVLIWILFVVVTMPDRWKGAGWAFPMLRQRLTLKYGKSKWPVRWRDDELRNVKRFVWCESRLDQIFVEACNELSALDSGGMIIR